MSIQKTLVTLVSCVSLGGFPLVAQAQAVLPHTVNLNWEQLTQDGLYLTEKAMLLMNMQQPALALQHAQLATQLAPTYYEGWFVLGTLYVRQEELEKAVTALNKAKRLESQEPGIYFTLGSAYFQKEDYAQAIAEIQQGLELNEDSVNAWFDLGNNHLMLNHAQEAVAAFERAIDLDPSFWYAINNIGLIYYEQGKTAEAVSQWEESLAIDEQASEPMLAIAVAIYKDGDPATAYELAQMALELDGRYGDLEFLEANLWGENLLADTAQFFETPAMVDFLSNQARFSDLEVEF